MGWDVYAYFDVDQAEIDDFIEKNNIDKHKKDAKIAQYFKDKYLSATRLKPIYIWNNNCGIHELFDFYGGVNYIRDDERFTNKRYIAMIEKKVGRSFPLCLYLMMTCLDSRDSALEISRELRVFFPEDEGILQFADWLDLTAKYCSTYELSR